MKLLFLIIACIGSISCKAPKRRIKGGYEINIEQAPYQVAVVINEKELLCGGVIIGPQTVLTAGHCVMNNPSNVKVRVGSSHSDRDGTLIDVSSIAVHPDFNDGTHDHDVAVLQLDSEITFSRTTKKLEIAGDDIELPEKSVLTVTGYGKSDESEDIISAVLKTTQVQTIDREKCAETFTSNNLTLSDTLSCTTSFAEDACTGDSGGPVVFKVKLVGIVSAGRECGSGEFPSVYTNIREASIRKFIEENLIKTGENLA